MNVDGMSQQAKKHVLEGIVYQGIKWNEGKGEFAKQTNIPGKQLGIL